MEDTLEYRFPEELKVFRELSGSFSLIGDSRPDLLLFSNVF